MWTQALTPLDREALDTPEANKNAYVELADAFNDRGNRQYQNVCIVYENGEPVNPFQPLPGMACIAQTCHDLDPNDDRRPERDAVWVEKQSKEIRGVMSKAYQNYRRSGNQDAENKYVEWCNFVTNVSDVYKYCFVVMPEGLLNQFGRALPENVQRDTGQKRRERDYSTSVSAVNRRRQRQRRRAEVSNSCGGLRTPSPDVGLQIPDVLQLALRQQQRQQALYHFASHGTETEKARAREHLSKIAFDDEDD